MMSRLGPNLYRPQYRFRANSGLCLTGDLRRMLPGVITNGIQFDLNLYRPCTARGCANFIWYWYRTIHNGKHTT